MVAPARGAARVPLVERGGGGGHEVPELPVVVGHVVGVQAHVLADELTPQAQREDVRRGRALAVLDAHVLDGGRDLRVTGPRPAVEVVRADARPHVVDDAHLGVHVHRVAGLAREAVDRDPVATGIQQLVHRELAAVELRRQGDRPVDVRDDRDDGDEPQLGVLPQRVTEVAADLLRPQVLVLEVDQPSGVPHGLGVAGRHAALAVGGEVVALGEDGRVGAQDLHRLLRAGRCGRWWGLLGQRPGREVLALGEAREDPPGVERERRGVLPALPEHRLDVEDRGALDGDVHVVPRRSRTEHLRHGDDLAVAVVLDAVAAAVAEVDAARGRRCHATGRRRGAGRRTSGGASPPCAPACRAGTGRRPRRSRCRAAAPSRRGSRSSTSASARAGRGRRRHVAPRPRRWPTPWWRGRR